MTTQQKHDIKIYGTSTGNTSLDVILGGKCSLEFSSLAEISGENGVGKTTLALHAIACCQRTSGVAAFIETEQAIDIAYMQKVGVDMNRLIFSQPTTMDDAFKIAFELIKSGTVNLIVFDSIASMLPKNEIENGLLAENVALEFSRELAKNLEKLKKMISNSLCTVIFINQLRQNPNTSEMYSIGGKPVDIYMDTRIRLKKGKVIISKKDNETKMGHHVIANVLKNTYGKKGCIATFSVHYQKGINVVLDTLNNAIENNIITESNNGYTVNHACAQGQLLGSSRNEALNTLARYPTFRTQIDIATVYEHLRRMKKSA